MVKNYNYSNTSNAEYSIFEGNQISFKSILDTLVTRKKIFIFLALTFFTILTGNLIFRRIARPIFRGSFILMISDPFVGDRKSADGAFSLENLALNQNKSDVPTLIAYLRSPKLLESIAKKNNLSPESLIGKVDINRPRLNRIGKQSDTLLVTLEGSNKSEMENIINKLSNEYVIAAATARKQQIYGGIKFLEEEEPKLIQKVSQNQKILEDFRLKNETLDPIKEGEFLKKNISEIEEKILSLNSENVRLEFIKENLENGILFTRGLNSGGISGDYFEVIDSDQLLLKEILVVKDSLAKAQSNYKDSSIVVQNLKEKLSQLEPILLEKQKSAVKAAITVNNSLIKSSNNKLIELKKTFAILPQVISEYSVIKQSLKNLEKNLLVLIQTKDKLQLEISQEILPWKIIDDPKVGQNPIKPNIKRNLIYISFLTFFFSSIITYLIDRIDNVFHNAAEVEKFIDIPILGFIPFFKFQPKDLLKSEDNKKDNSENKLFKDENFFIFQETFRNIYTSIKFSNIDKEIKTISLTSTIPQEGKSLCTVFLAINISEISKKVLIVDADLRRPSLHQKLDVDNISGLSNFLVNSKSNWKDYVMKHEKYDNLSYITAGKVPPNSIRLLESQKMNSLIEDLKSSNEYDLIIFDCPPVLGLGDSLIVSNFVDGIIVNVSLNKVDRNLATETIRKLNVLKTPILGLIINSVHKPAKEAPLKNKYFANYMPLETSERYGMNNQKGNESFDQKNSPTTIKEKLKLKLQKFLDWLNE